MKKWKCPECGETFEFLMANISGSCTVAPDGSSELFEWETGNMVCDCGYEEDYWRDNRFEVVEVEK